MDDRFNSSGVNSRAYPPSLQPTTTCPSTASLKQLTGSTAIRSHQSIRPLTPLTSGTTMSFSKALPQSLKELRVHMCQSSASSQGLRSVNAFHFVSGYYIWLTIWLTNSGQFLRSFILSKYPSIKAANPDLKVLIREARGVEPRVFARFGKWRCDH